MGVSSMAGKRFHSITVICGSGTCDPGTLFAAQELVILGPCLHRTTILAVFACRRASPTRSVGGCPGSQMADRQSGQTKVAAPTTRIQTKAWLILMKERKDKTH